MKGTTCKVGIVHYPEKLRPRDELVRLAWLAHGGQLALAGPGRIGQYIDAILWGQASDLDDTPPGTDERIARACELFASAALRHYLRLTNDLILHELAGKRR